MKAHILEGFGFRLAFLSFLLLLGVAGPAYAGQSGAPPPSTNTAAPAAVPAAAAPAAKPAAQAGQTAAAGAPAAKGNQEGIQIHGHWTIEVKDPDGKLVTHREFENSLAPSGSGASLLAAFLGGVAAPGSWIVQIRDLASDTTTFGNFIYMPENDSPAYLSCLFVSISGATCTASLSVTGPTLNAAVGTTPASFTGTTLTLAGSATVPPAFTAASIGYVETDNFPCPTSVTPQTCTVSPGNVTPPGTIIGPGFAFTERNLDGLSGDPAPVPVKVGQTVNVMVVISFQ